MFKNLDYIFLVLLLSFSTFEFFFRSEILMPILYGIAGLVVFLRKRSSNNRWITIFFTIITFFYVVQTILIDYMGIISLLSRLIALFGTYFIALIVKDRFSRIFVDTIYWISILSLVFYFSAYIPEVKSFFMEQMAPYFKSINVENAVFEGGGINIIIYNYLTGLTDSNGFMRNSGPFWEPGMFAVFLNLALFVNNFFDKSKKKGLNVVLIITLATTLSTGGYVGGFFTLFFYMVKDRRINIFTLFLGSITIFYLYSFFYRLDFVGQKIIAQYSNAELGSDVSRWGAFLTQINMIQASPLFGGEELSRYVSTEFGTLASGTLLPFVVLGIPVGLFYFLVLIKSSFNLGRFYGRKSKIGLFFFLLILILSFPQTILLSPFLFTIIFIGLLSIKDYRHV